MNNDEHEMNAKNTNTKMYELKRKQTTKRLEEEIRNNSNLGLLELPIV